MAMDLPQPRSLQQAPKIELDVGHLVTLLITGDIATIRHWFQNPEGVDLLDGLHEVERVLAEWKRSHS